MNQTKHFSTRFYGGNTINLSGYLANLYHSAQINVNNTGALTHHEAQQMGLPLVVTDKPNCVNYHLFSCLLKTFSLFSV